MILWGMAYSYPDLQKRVASLLKPKGMGSVQFVKTVTIPAAQSWDPPITTSTFTNTPAVVVGISSEFAASDSAIKSTDLSVTTLLPDDLPEVGDNVVVNGLPLTILAVRALPAGEPVALHMVVSI